jgi:hypothetical protein
VRGALFADADCEASANGSAVATIARTVRRARSESKDIRDWAI